MEIFNANDTIFSNSTLNDFLNEGGLCAREVLYYKSPDERLTHDSFESYFTSKRSYDCEEYENVVVSSLEPNEDEDDGAHIGSILFDEVSGDEVEPFNLIFPGKLMFDSEKGVLQYIGPDPVKTGYYDIWEIKRK